jgi:GntR family transcriptional regulator
MTAMRLDHRSAVPLRAQVERLLRELIQEPVYRDGGLLPDEVTLAQRLGISRGTIRAGIARLVFEGRLERKAGIGTRVTTPRPFQSGIGAWHSFTHELERQGIQVETFSLEARHSQVTQEAAQALQVAPKTKLLRLDRLRGWTGQPVVHFRSWLHSRLGLTGTEDFSRPLYEILEQSCGVVADQSREELRAVSADARLADLLRVRKGAPLLLRCRTVLDPGGRPIEFAEVHYRSDRFTLTLDIRKDAS